MQVATQKDVMYRALSRMIGQFGFHSVFGHELLRNPAGRRLAKRYAREHGCMDDYSRALDEIDMDRTEVRRTQDRIQSRIYIGNKAW